MANVAALASVVDRLVLRLVSTKGGRRASSTETMVRILVLKQLHNLSDEQAEVQLLDRPCIRRFCGLRMPSNVPRQTTVSEFENRIDTCGAIAHLLWFGSLFAAACALGAVWSDGNPPVFRCYQK